MPAAGSPSTTTSGKIRVVARVRPLLPRELLDEECVSVREDGRTVAVASTVSRNNKENVNVVTSGFDAVLGTNAGQVGGEEGTGKTYTMLGAEPSAAAYADPRLAHLHGITPRAAQELFAAGPPGLAVKCSYVYNEKLYDLLAGVEGGVPTKPMRGSDPLDVGRVRAGLELREEGGGVYVEGLTEIEVGSAGAVMALVGRGQRTRATRHTEMNQMSSRSHAVLTLELSSNAGEICGTKLRLVDLAGSERWDTGIQMGAGRERELTAINTSLSALTSVIASLTESGRSHVPFRDSALTFLLQDSLAGNCRTALIATLSPAKEIDRLKGLLALFVQRSDDGSDPLSQMEARLRSAEADNQRLKAALAEEQMKMNELLVALQTKPVGERRNNTQAETAGVRARQLDQLLV
eukprot:jgi/Chlat1/7462/Chrsp6S09191